MSSKPIHKKQKHIHWTDKGFVFTFDFLLYPFFWFIHRFYPYHTISKRRLAISHNCICNSRIAYQDCCLPQHIHEEKKVIVITKTYVRSGRKIKKKKVMHDPSYFGEKLSPGDINPLNKDGYYLESGM